MTQSKAKGKLLQCEVFLVKSTWMVTFLFWLMAFLRKLSQFCVISLSFHRSSCVNVEDFSIIATVAMHNHCHYCVQHSFEKSLLRIPDAVMFFHKIHIGA